MTKKEIIGAIDNKLPVVYTGDWHGEIDYARISKATFGCPFQGSKGMKRDFQKYPIYRQNYVKAFDRMLLKI